MIFFFRVVKDDLERMDRLGHQERGYVIRYLDFVNSRMTRIILTQTKPASKLPVRTEKKSAGAIQIIRRAK